MTASRPAPTLPVWQHDSPAITAAIRARRAPFKIVLKTRNDPLFLPDWIAHHAAIVGYEGLIIADNMSDDPEVLEQLQALAERACVFRFEGFHNDLHDRAKYPDLFAAIEASSDWLTLIDTDERLVWAEADGSWIADRRILDKLAERGAISAIPGVLIDNFGSDADRFVLRQGEAGLSSLVRWGKPVIRSGAAVGPGHKCHNIQFEKSLFDHHERAHFFQLHLLNLLPEQRLRANREKLVTRGFFPPGVSDQEIAAAKVARDAPGLLQRCVNETRRLLSGKSAQNIDDTIRLLPDGTIDGTEVQRARFGELIDRSAAFLDAMLRANQPRNRR